MAKILLIRTDGIGDVLLSTPLAGALKACRAEDEIWLLTRWYTREIGECHPDVYRVLTIDNEYGEQLTYRQLVRMLKKRHFDAAILVHPRFVLAAALASAGIPVRIGTGYRWYSFLLTHRVYEHRKTVEKHELEYNLGLLKPLGITAVKGKLIFEVPHSAHERVRDMLERMEAPDSRPFIVLHPGSGGSAMEWPVHKYRALASELVKSCNAAVMVTGGKGEEDMLEQFRKRCDVPVSILPRRLSLSELAALLKKASLVVTNSTGPLHLAVAVGTPVVGLYPPVKLCSPLRWGPYGAPDSVIQPGCPEYSTRKEALKRAPDCMDLISVDQVMKTALQKM